MKIDALKETMDFNGYSHFNLENYQAKNNLPCFISENSDEAESWESLNKEAIETIKTKEFLLAVAENYDREDLIDEIENSNDIDFVYYFSLITKESIENFATNFMDSYFLGGDEVWCSFSTKLDEYTN